MINPFGLISSICFLIGNILSIGYSFDLLKKSIQLHKFASLLVGLIILIVTLLPLVVIYAIAHEFTHQYSKYFTNLTILLMFSIAFFACGIKLTRFLWPIQKKLESILEEIKDGATIFEIF